MTVDEAARPLARVRGAGPAHRAGRGRPLGHRHRVAAVRARPARHRRRLHDHPGHLRAAGDGQPVPAEQVAWARSVRSVVNAYVVPGSPSAADLAAADRDGSCRGERTAGCGRPVPPTPRTRWPVPRPPASTRVGGGSTSRTSPSAPCGAPTPTPTRRCSSAGATRCAGPASRSGSTPPAATGARSSGTGRPTWRSGPRSAWPASAPPSEPAAARSPAGRCWSPSG